MADTIRVQRAPSAPLKYSRYVKNRRAQTLELQAQASAPATAAAAPMSASVPKSDTIARSMSRYHKNRPRAQNVAQNAPTQSKSSAEVLSFGGVDEGRHVEDKYKANADVFAGAPHPAQERYRRSSSRHIGNGSSDQQGRPSLAQRLSDQQKASGNDKLAAQELIDLQQSDGDDERAQVAEQLLQKSKMEDLARLEKTLEAAAQPTRGRAQDKSAWGMLKRKMSRPRAHTGTIWTNSDRTIPQDTDWIIDRDQEHGGTREENGRRKNADRDVASAKRGLDAPLFDAAERQVDVCFEGMRKAFVVEKTTTTQDVLHLATQIFRTRFNIDAAVLKESYKANSLKLERRLRMYEKLLPVLNSWDRDTQNELILEASDSPKNDTDLLSRGAPQVQPNAISMHMYHSFKKGRWIKSWVTLSSDGQVYLSKHKPDAGRTTEVRGIGHMSDFDIYTMKKNDVEELRPKRKHVCVIKSQQKQILFEGHQENFVHFFSTSHPTDYQEWVDACQEWRSWYLSKPPKVLETNPLHNIAMPGKNTYTFAGYHKDNNLDGESSGWQLNSPVKRAPARLAGSGLQPNINQHTASIDDEDEDDDYRSPVSPRQTTRQIPFHLRHASQCYPRPVPTTAPIAQEPFNQGGLLGRSFSQRHQYINGDPRLGNPDFMGEAFTGGLLADPKYNGLQSGGGPYASQNGPANGGYTNRPSTSHNNSAHNTPKTYAVDSVRRPSLAHSRAGSRPGTSGSGTGDGSVPPVPELPCLGTTVKPLVDFTPQFQEAPQWRSEGKGHGVKAKEGVPLVDLAGSKYVDGKKYNPKEFRRLPSK